MQDKYWDFAALAVVAALRVAGFAASIATVAMTGRDPRNTCNLGRSRAGVQLESPLGERERFLREAAALARYAAAVTDGSA